MAYFIVLLVLVIAVVLLADRCWTLSDENKRLSDEVHRRHAGG